MFYQIERTSNAPTNNHRDNKKDKDKDKDKAVPGVVAVLACVLSIGLSGYISLVVTDPDQGKTITLAESNQLMLKDMERIKNSPHMPPQAKKMALMYLERYNSIGEAMRSHQN